MKKNKLKMYFIATRHGWILRRSDKKRDIKRETLRGIEKLAVRLLKDLDYRIYYVFGYKISNEA